MSTNVIIISRLRTIGIKKYPEGEQELRKRILQKFVIPEQICNTTAQMHIKCMVYLILQRKVKH